MISEESKTFLKQINKYPKHAVMLKVKRQLEEYFSGKRKAFDLSLCFDGTPFQIQAWQALCKIPYRQTISYGKQASWLGNKNKAKAVGLG